MWENKNIDLLAGSQVFAARPSDRILYKSRLQNTTAGACNKGRTILIPGYVKRILLTCVVLFQD